MVRRKVTRRSEAETASPSFTSVRYCRRSGERSQDRNLEAQVELARHAAAAAGSRAVARRCPERKSDRLPPADDRPQE